jgi:hypothetical protein
MRYVKFCCTASEDTSAHIPACPKANEKEGGCSYVMKQIEVERILKVDKTIVSKDEELEWSDGEELLKTLSKLYLVSKLW